MALRLPMSGGFESFSNVKDIPFIARHASLSRDEVCKKLKLPADKPLVLASFGGFGLPALDTDTHRQVQEIHGGLRRQRCPRAAQRKDTPAVVERKGAFISINEEAMYDAGVRYEDLVGAAEVVVTKPGYGIVSECIANDTAILYTSRGHFPEYDVLVEEMPKYMRSAFISQDDLFAGKVGIGDRQAAGAGEAEEEAGDQRGRRRRRHPAEGARQAAAEAARPAAHEGLSAVATRTRLADRAGAAATLLLFTQVTSDQMRGKFTFSIEMGWRSAWARKPGRSRSDLKPM